MSKDQTQLKAFLQAESVFTIATGDACGSWSAPVLFVADISAEPFVLYFLSSANSRHIKSLPVDGAAAVSIYSDYDGNWQSIRGAQIHGTIEQVADVERAAIAGSYFARFPEIQGLIDSPQTKQEELIGAAFGRSHFYCVTPSFVRFTNNGDSFAGRTEWQL
ncbi:pyridoxamine 5'-phosphate oxidase family protein [Porticoccaceae bacterium]|nr:pyridoxamine 5'-phosphate oxidase family protein [Porticoccaceae bacterium]